MGEAEDRVAGAPAPGGEPAAPAPATSGGEPAWAAPAMPAASPAATAGLAGRLRGLPLAARAGLAVAGAAAVIVVVLLLSGGTASLPGVASPPGALADPVPYDGRSPGQPGGEEQRVIVQMSRKPLGELPDARAMGAEAQAVWIKSLKSEQITLRSALQARGIVLRDVVSYYRVYDGFAATVRTQDIGRLNSRGARVRTVRRVYPASGEPVAVPGPRPKEKPASQGQPPVALLDTGVDLKALRAHADPGYDAVDRDGDPAPGRDPAGTGRRETSGTALAGVLAQAGERIMPIRVASLRASPSVEALGTTDELLAGLERAVDPNGDLDSSDHAPVALVGVNSPYAGFADSPEAQAVAGAAGLGTLVVAPAGNEGAARPGSGTIGSPAAAAGALAVGALAGPEPAPRVELKAGGETIARAAVLGGTPPAAAGLRTSGPVTIADPAVLGRQGPKLRRTAVIVRAGDNPAAQAAAAAAVGAYVVLLADPRERPLPAMSAGRAAAPVIGVTGAAARALLKLKPGTEVSFGAVERGPRSEEPAAHASPYTSEGPSAGGEAKPDLAAAGSALTVAVGGGAATAGGSAIAAARVAAAAARLFRAHPELNPAQLRAELMAAADPAHLPPERTGAGALREPGTPAGAGGGAAGSGGTGGSGGAAGAGGGAAGSGGTGGSGGAAGPGGAAGSGGTGGSGGAAGPALGAITADPPAPASGPLDPIALRLKATVSASLRLRASDNAQVTPATLTLRPGAPAAVSIRPPKPGAGRLEALDDKGRTVASIPFLVRPQDAPAVPLGALRTSKQGRSVRFTLGAFDRGDPLNDGTEVRFAERLVLDIVNAQRETVRTLTVADGARELIPAEYAYTLSAADFKALPPGRYAFRARAWAPRRSTPVERFSKAFRR